MYKPLNSLPSPKKCSKIEALKSQKPETRYKGPYINKTDIRVPDLESTSIPEHTLADIKPLPKEFSWYQTSGNKIENGYRDQKDCGSCWAMAISSVLGDKYALKYNIEAPYLSSMWVMGCTKNSSGEYSKNSNQLCDSGGSVWEGAKWLESKEGGVKLESCWPYSLVTKGEKSIALPCPKSIGYNTDLLPDNTDSLSDNCCYDCCGKKQSSPVFKIKPNSVKHIIVKQTIKEVKEGEFPKQIVVKADAEKTTLAIQNEILNNGPVVASFFAYGKDFEDWWIDNAGSDKVYIPSVIPNIGEDGHSVVLTGWGVSKGVRYWEMRNSWGAPGYCRFAFSLDTPKGNWTGIDVPFYDETYKSWSGGVIAFEADKKPDYNFVKGYDGPPLKIGGSTKISWNLLGAVGGILVAVILFKVVFRNSKK